MSLFPPDAYYCTYVLGLSSLRHVPDRRGDLLQSALPGPQTPPRFALLVSRDGGRAVGECLTRCFRCSFAALSTIEPTSRSAQSTKPAWFA